MRHVICLSTIPPRFASIGATLNSLIRQSSRAEAVELYIPRNYRRFPQWSGALPDVPEGVTLVRVEEDFGPATKVLPAIRAYRGQDLDLIFTDDDHMHAPDWAARFLNLRRTRPGDALCAAATTIARMGRDWQAQSPLPRAVVAPDYQLQFGYQMSKLFGALTAGNGKGVRLLAPFRKLDRSGYADIAEGYGGVAVRPEFLDDAAFAIPPVLWAVDDVWLSGHLTRCGIPIWADRALNRVRAILPLSRTQPLYSAVIEGADRPSANLACVDYMRATYGIWGGVADQST